MKEYIIANAPTIALYAGLVVALAAAAFLAIKLGYKKKVAAIAYNFVCSAEEQITGTKRGQERKAQVLAWLHDCIPAPLRLFITEADLDRIIETAVARMKTALKEAAENA